MKTVDAKTLDVSILSSFWNEYAQNEIVIKKFSPEKFKSLFFDEYTGVKKVSVAALDGDKVIGFAAGTHKAGMEVGYITYVLVDKDYRRQKIGKALAEEIEKLLKEVADVTLTKYEAVFYNPVGLSWIVPGTDGHDHFRLCLSTVPGQCGHGSIRTDRIRSEAGRSHGGPSGLQLHDQ